MKMAVLTCGLVGVVTTLPLAAQWQPAPIPIAASQAGIVVLLFALAMFGACLHRRPTTLSYRAQFGGIASALVFSVVTASFVRQTPVLLLVPALFCVPGVLAGGLAYALASVRDKP